MKVIKESDFFPNSHKDLLNDVFVIPTETVYGLAASIYNKNALEKIFKLKRRPIDNPLIVHVSSVEMLKSVIKGEISEDCQKLINEFWPGPLSLLFKANDSISKIVTGGLDTIVVRMPNNKTVLSIIEKFNTPLAAPSANISGRPSPTHIDHVIHDFKDNVKLYIDGGSCSIGLESTVLTCLEKNPCILRPGFITKEQIERVIGKEVLINSKVEKDAPVCPGQKYKHYSPKNKFILIKIFDVDITETIIKLASDIENCKIGILKHKNVVFDGLKLKNHRVIDLGKNKKDICANIFYGLRELDKDCDIIITCSVSENDEGAAIMDRIEKAASQIVVNLTV